MDIPAGALPAGALRVGGGDAEPVVVSGLVHARVRDQRPVFLLQPLRPRRPVPRPRSRRQQRDLRQSRFRVPVPTLHSLILILINRVIAFFDDSPLFLPMPPPTKGRPSPSSVRVMVKRGDVLYFGASVIVTN